MSALEVLHLAFQVGVVVSLWLVAARIRGIGADDDARPSRPLPQAAHEFIHEGSRPMTLSDNQRRRHGLALVRRTIASGKYTKKDVSRWEDEFGTETVQELLPEDSKTTTSSSFTSSKSKE